MNSLGLSFDFHDASAAVVRDSILLATSAEERFTLQKHDASFPSHAIATALESAQMSASDLDVVAFYERPTEKFTRVLHCAFEDFPRGNGRFVTSMKKWLGSTLWTRNLIASELGIKPSVVEFFSHHESHVAQAFSESPFEHAAVLIVDGVGEWACTTLARVNRSGSIQIIEQHEYPESIGLVYAAFTAFLGFKPNSGESSTMALAAFGRPRYVAEIEKVMRSNQDGTYSVDATYFDFLREDDRLFTLKFIDLLGSPRSIKAAYPFDTLQDEQHGVSEDDQRHADIAASLQVVLTDILLGLCKRLRAACDETALCFAGGVALNCLANTELVKRSGFSNFFIPADPGDGGAAVGAAALAGGFKHASARSSPYLGAGYGETLASDLLDPVFLQRLATENHVATVTPPDAIRMESLDQDRLVEEVTLDLSKGKIVAWVQGRSECGQRALGNRSILVDPSNLDAVRRMSRTIKSHTKFRPYALSIAIESATDVLDCAYTDEPVLRWMQTIWPVKAHLRDRLRAGLHFDGTTRPQLCSQADNPLYWKLLHSFASYSGLPVLLNTSYNERSMPMIGTSLGALATFLRTGVDTLVLGNWILRKAMA